MEVFMCPLLILQNFWQVPESKYLENIPHEEMNLRKWKYAYWIKSFVIVAVVANDEKEK